MCEYCGCQAVPAVELLTSEHEVVVNLIGAVQRALNSGDLDRAGELTRRMSAVLGPHTRVEEDALFPAMGVEFPEHVAALRGEHRLVEGVLAESTEATPTDPEWARRLADASHTLRDHILKEQDGLFPAALASLGPAEWEAVDETRARVGTALTDLAPALS
jgi:hemerythrin-like domain-containing protein